MPAIYTRTGDKGDTALFGGSRVAKQSLRVEAYGSVDEANAAIGEAKALLNDGCPWRDRVHAIQHRLFVLAAELASDADGAEKLGGVIDTDDIEVLEHLIDDCLAVSGPQRFFVVPGRDPRSAAFHSARTVVRRAERRTLTLAETEPVRPLVIKYLNRLSDAVYALARLTETWADHARIERIVRNAVTRALAESGDGPLGEDSCLARAKALVEAAERRAREIGVPVVAAVVDPAGHPLVLHRMAGSLLASIDIAGNKAWSAAAFKATTAQLGELAAEGGPLPGLADGNDGRVVLFGGGVPLFEGATLLGGFGVSGGTVEQDIDIVRHALVEVMGEQS